MVVLYVFAALIGSVGTVTLVWPYGWLVGLLCAPLGGTAVALMAATVMFVLRAERRSARPSVAAAPSR